MRWAADKPRFQARDGRVAGHHLKRQHSNGTERRSGAGDGGGSAAEAQIAFPDLNCDKKIRRGRFPPLFLGLLMAEAGRREKDVYFPTVPSQKSTPSALATITEQLLWLGGPGLGSPHPAASCQPGKAAPPARSSHPGVQK